LDFLATSIQAQVWLDQKNLAKAVALLETVKPHDLVKPFAEYSISMKSWTISGPPVDFVAQAEALPISTSARVTVGIVLA